MPFRVKLLFVFWPVVFVIGYFMWSSAASARKYPTENFWRQFFLWYWRRDEEDEARAGDSPTPNCPRCGSFTARMSDIASYCPSCRREVVHESG
jgi:glycosyltransferase involved in cell wall biosynthesis/ribosomal protein S27AE